jgi:hypothetical protein
MTNDSAETPVCLWCGHSLSRGRRRGSPKRFCSEAHRHDFWSAARRWVTQALAQGLLTADNLRDAASARQAQGVPANEQVSLGRHHTQSQPKIALSEACTLCRGHRSGGEMTTTDAWVED